MSEERLQDLTTQGFEALHAGEAQEAVRILRQALDLAAEECPEKLDEARVNVAQALEQAGEYEEAEKGLREILLRSRRSELTIAAAVTVGRARRHRRDPEKAAFYIDRALQEAREMGDPVRLGQVLIERGNLAMNANRFDEAATNYRDALESFRVGGQLGFAEAVSLDNLGYALLLGDRVEEGLPHLEESFLISRRHGFRRYIAESSQDLCFGWLKLERPEDAVAPGERALAEAEDAGYQDIVKNTLYLLGEAYTRLDRGHDARLCFRRLQAFYPGMQDLGAFLKLYDISAMITLKEF